MLTQVKLKELLKYDPKNGVFTKNGYSKCGTLSLDGYVLIGTPFGRFYAHRLAWLYMTGVWPDNEVDHINRVRDDNRWANLRDVDRTTNNRNSPRVKAGIPNISYQHKAWCVRLGRKKYVGRFQCLGKALQAKAEALSAL